MDIASRDRGRTWAGRSRSCRTSPARRSAPGASRAASRSSCAGASGVTITTDETIEGTAELISTTYDPLPRDVSPGDRILLDDGNLELRVVRASLTEVECEVVDGGLLKSNKGMNLPGVKLSTPALTEKDRRDLAFGVEERGRLRRALVRAPGRGRRRSARRSSGRWAATCPVIAKIEKREAIDDLPAILEATDGVMVARGRPGGRALDRRGADAAEADHRDGQRRGQGRDHGHPDAGEHDRQPAAHPRGGLRRGQRDPGRDRRHHALGGDGLRTLPGGGRGHHGAHRLLHRGALRRLPHARRASASRPRPWWPTRWPAWPARWRRSSAAS